MELKKKLALRWQGKQNIIVISLPVDALAQAGHAYGLGPQLGTQRLGSTMARKHMAWDAAWRNKLWRVSLDDGFGIVPNALIQIWTKRSWFVIRI